MEHQFLIMFVVAKMSYLSKERMHVGTQTKLNYPRASIFTT